MKTAAKDLLETKFIEEALTREIHDLLSLTYARSILEYLERKDTVGATLRDIDVEAVGTSGATKTTRNTLEKLIAAGWVARRVARNSKRNYITDRGRGALDYAKHGGASPKAERKGRV